jgi:hypothetical protein
MRDAYVNAEMKNGYIIIISYLEKQVVVDASKEKMLEFICLNIEWGKLAYIKYIVQRNKDAKTQMTQHISDIEKEELNVNGRHLKTFIEICEIHMRDIPNNSERKIQL